MPAFAVRRSGRSSLPAVAGAASRSRRSALVPTVSGARSHRPWRDVVGVLRVQRDRLDHGELAARAERLGVADLVARALREVGSERR
jgi:hypothetical protein